VTNSLTTEQLTLLIVQKHQVLVQLRDLARTQLQVIAADDTDRLLSLLAVKQPLLAELQRVERALDPFREQDPERRIWPAADTRRRCQVVAERANALLQELLQLEQQAEGQLVLSRDETAQQLQMSSGAHAARQAYVVVPSLPTSGGLDLLSET
jgi:hypothetical protein